MQCRRDRLRSAKILEYQEERKSNEMRRTIRHVLSAALIALLVSAGFIGAISSVMAQDGSANVRVVHASPDAPAVDVFVDGNRAIESLEFGDATDWIALPAGSYDVAVAPAGADESDAVISGTFDLASGVYYNVAATGFLSEIDAQVYVTNVEGLASGQARVQVIHASPDAPAVDVAVAGGPVLVGGLEFPNASGSLDVDAGTYDLEVRPAGTEDVVLDLPGVALDSGTVYDIFAIGSLEDGTLNVLPLTTAAAAGAGDDSAPSGTGGVATTPSTGVGSTIQSGGPAIWAMLAVAVLLLAAGGATRLAPARSR